MRAFLGGGAAAAGGIGGGVPGVWEDGDGQQPRVLAAASGVAGDEAEGEDVNHKRKRPKLQTKSRHGPLTPEC